MEIYICVGLPMSGKSTWAKNNVNTLAGEGVIIECDGIRKMLTKEDDKYKAFKKENESLVWDMFENILESSMFYNKRIIISNTNTNLLKLQQLVDWLPDNYAITFVVFDVSPFVCCARLNPKHEHMVDIINKMNTQIHPTFEWIKENKYDYFLIDARGEVEIK